MMVILLFNRNEERGEELKVPHHARATLVRDSNMPSVTAACLIPDISKGFIRPSISLAATPILLIKKLKGGI